jgi:hypothetical protein
MACGRVVPKVRLQGGALAILLGGLLAVTAAPARAQSSPPEFLPEIDTYVKLNSDVRFVFQAKDTREGGDPDQAEIGPSVEFFLKPLVRLKKITEFDLDDAKARPLVFAIGYRYVASPGKAGTNRMEPVVTFHLPTKFQILLSDRNRADLDWQNGAFKWRYRNRITAERRIAIRSYHPAPYVSAEFFYTSQYQKWSTTALYVGCLFDVVKHVQLDPYYEHENNTGKSPNQPLNLFGLVLNLRF